jgi:predicted phosphoribosyltransferase
VSREGATLSNLITFTNRFSAGEKLAELVAKIRNQLQNQGLTAPTIVYALPRGGIPVAIPVAKQLGCPLSVIVSKKITLPHNPELAIGAVTTDENVVWGNPQFLEGLGVSRLNFALETALNKARQQWLQFAPYCPTFLPQSSIAILVDDGIATGMTIAAAAEAMRLRGAKEVWLCAPVAPAELVTDLREWGDRMIVVATPDPFLSVSRFYLHFPQVATEEALAYLMQYNQQFMANIA